MKKNLLLLSLMAAAFFAHAQNTGIGTTSPLTKLHVFNGASGAIPFAFSPLVVENNGHTYINILSPAANEGAILFGRPGSSANGVIMYNNTSTPNGFQFRNNNNLTRMVINNTGNVGIGTVTPLARLHIADSSVLFSAAGAAAVSPGNPPASGGGRRMMWYTDKAAFRAGYVSGTNWDKTNTGAYSVALGYDTKAAGNYSVAMGYQATALPDWSVAMGNQATVSGGFMALGAQTTASGEGSIAMGYQTTALSSYETVLGIFSTYYTPLSTTGWDPTDRLFVIGNGVNLAARSDAFIIYKNGNATLAGTLTQNSDARLKKDIVPLQNSLQKIILLNGYTYRWRNKYADNSLQTGVLAQEVQKIFPQLVKEDKEGMLSVNYSGLVPVLIESIKEQQKQIEELKKLVEKLVK